MFRCESNLGGGQILNETSFFNLNNDQLNRI